MPDDSTVWDSTGSPGDTVSDMPQVTVTANPTDWGTIIMWLLIGGLVWQMGKDAKYW